MASAASKAFDSPKQACGLIGELRQLNLASAKASESCAEIVRDPRLKRLFAEVAHTRRENAHTLGTHLEWQSAAQPSLPMLSARSRRIWNRLHKFCSDDATDAVLSEVVREEIFFRQSYDEAIFEALGTPLQQYLIEQLNGTQRIEERLKANHLVLISNRNN